MGDGSVVPVAVGLAVGVAFVIVFSWVSNLDMFPSSSRQEDVHDFAVITTKDLNDVKQFFSTYRTANTTVYFITTCTDESCSSLGRIPSVWSIGSNLKTKNILSSE